MTRRAHPSHRHRRGRTDAGDMPAGTVMVLTGVVLILTTAALLILAITHLAPVPK